MALIEANLAKQATLLKYEKPEFLGRDNKRRQIVNYDQNLGSCNKDDDIDEELIQKCKESLSSQLDGEEILNSIAPLREWEEDGRHYLQKISNQTTTRIDILDLNDALNEQLTNRQANHLGICPIRRELADQTFDELIRQITISQPERGLLLLRVRDELRMTLLGYQDLFVSSMLYDPYKNVLQESFSKQHDMDSKLDELNEAVKQLQEERDAMVKVLECEEQVFEEKREAGNMQHGEEFQFLKRANNVLKLHIEAMLDPKNNIDPVIEAFDCHPKPKDSRQRKGMTGPCINNKK